METTMDIRPFFPPARKESGRDLQQLSHRHLAVADWLLQNPDKTQRECARALGYTEGYLSLMIRTDAFQAYMKERTEFLDHEVLVPARTKLLAISHQALDNIAERMCDEDVRADLKFNVDVVDKTLSKLGYGQKQPATGQTVNVYSEGGTVNIGELEEARSLMQAARTLAPGPEGAAELPGAPLSFDEVS